MLARERELEELEPIGEQHVVVFCYPVDPPEPCEAPLASALLMLHGRPRGDPGGEDSVADVLARVPPARRPLPLPTAVCPLGRRARLRADTGARADADRAWPRCSAKSQRDSGPGGPGGSGGGPVVVRGGPVVVRGPCPRNPACPINRSAAQQSQAPTPFFGQNSTEPPRPLRPDSSRPSVCDCVHPYPPSVLGSSDTHTRRENGV